MTENPAMPREEAVAFFAHLFGGEHHIPGGKDKGVKPFGMGWCVNSWKDFATFDGGRLTSLVFLAHDHCVRAEVMPSGPRMVKIAIWKRSGEEGSIWQRHPSLDQAIAGWRKRNPSPTPPAACLWQEDADGTWHPACGPEEHAWCFESGDPKTNKMHFCHGCGHPLGQQSYEEVDHA